MLVVHTYTDNDGQRVSERERERESLFRFRLGNIFVVVVILTKLL
jgi:hypothetical protein